ncbi:hypothetical protein ACJX0J_009239, partial [Zea mays]
ASVHVALLLPLAVSIEGQQVVLLLFHSLAMFFLKYLSLWEQGLLDQKVSCAGEDKEIRTMYGSILAG